MSSIATGTPDPPRPGNSDLPGPDFSPGKRVRIKGGPFENYDGVLHDYNPRTRRYKVEIDIYGRTSFVKLKGSQIERA